MGANAEKSSVVDLARCFDRGVGRDRLRSLRGLEWGPSLAALAGASPAIEN